jgi:hypothetical protein
MSPNASPGMISWVWVDTGTGQFQISHGKTKIMIPTVLEVTGVSAEDAVVAKGVAIATRNSSSYVKLPISTDAYYLVV